MLSQFLKRNTTYRLIGHKIYNFLTLIILFKKIVNWLKASITWLVTKIQQRRRSS